MYIYLHTHFEGVYVCVHIGVGFGVACSDVKAMREPQIAEQQQCSPAFLYILLFMSNFSWGVQGILRTLRYVEKLFMNYSTS